MKPSEVETGHRFGRLTVVDSAGKKDRKALFFVACDCGHEPFIVRGSHLTSGSTVSCGCKKLEHIQNALVKHRMSFSPEYYSWGNMIQRCTNPKATKFDIYGGRGISVCERWKDFTSFYDDMGPRPKGHTLDRYPDNDGNYEPDNVRWATRQEQEANKRPYTRVNPKRRSTPTPTI